MPGAGISYKKTADRVGSVSLMDIRDDECMLRARHEGIWDSRL